MRITTKRKYKNRFEIDKYISKEFKRYWRYIRKLIIDRDRKKCILCNKKTHLTVHHIDNKGFAVPLNQRNDHYCNLLTLCAPCHEHVDLNPEDIYFQPKVIEVPEWKSLSEWEQEVIRLKKIKKMMEKQQ